MDHKPSARNATADAASLNDEVICAGCFKMICNYDEARSNAKRLKKQIRQKLTITETYFEQIQNGMDANATQTAMVCDDNNGQQEQQNQQSNVMIMEDDVCDVIDLCDDD